MFWWKLTTEMDLHCGHIKFAELTEPGVIEVKCRSTRCGAEKGVVVIHKFDTMTGELLSTKKFREPMGGTNAVEHSSASVRSA